MQHKKRRWLSYLPKTIGVALWVCLIILCLILRDEITLENIVNFTPKNPALAILIILFLYALKGISMPIYGGILYAASGIIFPLPTAIAVNTAGSVIMTTMPFLIGKHLGAKLLDRLVQKNPKLELLRSFPKQNDLLILFLVRLVGVLPADLVSMYLGASGLDYFHYIIGTIAGLLPSIINFSVMGMSINDVSSPAFWLSLICEICLSVFSVIIFYVLKKKKEFKS